MPQTDRRSPHHVTASLPQVGDIAASVDEFLANLKLYTDASYGIGDWGLGPLLDNLTTITAVSAMSEDDDEPEEEEQQEGEEQDEESEEEDEFSAVFQFPEPLVLTGPAKTAEFETLAALPAGARIMMDFQDARGWYGAEILGPDTSRQSSATHRNVRFDDEPDRPRNIDLRECRQITALASLSESEAESSSRSESESESESGTETESEADEDGDEESGHTIGWKTTRNGKPFVHQLTLPEADLDAWKQRFERMVRCYANHLKEWMAEYFPSEGAGSEYRWWTGAPAQHTTQFAQRLVRAS